MSSDATARLASGRVIKRVTIATDFDAARLDPLGAAIPGEPGLEGDWSPRDGYVIRTRFGNYIVTGKVVT